MYHALGNLGHRGAGTAATERCESCGGILERRPARPPRLLTQLSAVSQVPSRKRGGIL